MPLTVLLVTWAVLVFPYIALILLAGLYVWSVCIAVGRTHCKSCKTGLPGLSAKSRARFIAGLLVPFIGAAGLLLTHLPTPPTG